MAKEKKTQTQKTQYPKGTWSSRNAPEFKLITRTGVNLLTGGAVFAATKFIGGVDTDKAVMAGAITAGGLEVVTIGEYVSDKVKQKSDMNMLTYAQKAMLDGIVSEAESAAAE